MKPIKILAIVVLGVFLSSCYHAKITTGAQPSGETIDKAWAHGFIFGLVPPKEVRTASECPNGVAKVDTQISFLNGLVSALTANIYTPMHITVSCAAGAATAAEINGEEDFTVSKDSDDAAVIRTIQEASEKSVDLQKPVFVRFE